MKDKMTSRERVLAAVRKLPVDYVPCVPFMNSQDANQRRGRRWQFPFGPSDTEALDFMVGKLGTDYVLRFSTGNHPAPGVSSKTSIKGDILQKTWATPSGELKAAIRHNEQWPHGFDIPFFSDYNPAHFVEPWIKSERDVDCLRHVLLPPHTQDDTAELRFRFSGCRRLSRKYQVPILFEAGLGLTGAVQMFGPSEISMMSLENPGLVDYYLETDHLYNMKAMEIGLDLGIDMVRRNGFYETCDLFSPAILDKFLGKRLREEAGLARSAGKPCGYTILSGFGPVAGSLAKAGFDSLFFPDVFLRGADGKKLSEEAGHGMSFWTGPSDTIHLPAENPGETRRAVRHVFELFGKTGLILSPCSSCKAVFPWENVTAMIDEWRKLR